MLLGDCENEPENQRPHWVDVTCFFVAFRDRSLSSGIVVPFLMSLSAVLLLRLVLRGRELFFRQITKHRISSPNSHRQWTPKRTVFCQAEHNGREREIRRRKSEIRKKAEIRNPKDLSCCGVHHWIFLGVLASWCEFFLLLWRPLWTSREAHFACSEYSAVKNPLSTSCCPAAARLKNDRIIGGQLLQIFRPEWGSVAWSQRISPEAFSALGAPINVRGPWSVSGFKFQV